MEFAVSANSLNSQIQSFSCQSFLRELGSNIMVLNFYHLVIVNPLNVFYVPKIFLNSDSYWQRKYNNKKRSWCHFRLHMCWFDCCFYFILHICFLHEVDIFELKKTLKYVA